MNPFAARWLALLVFLAAAGFLFVPVLSLGTRALISAASIVLVAILRRRRPGWFAPPIERLIVDAAGVRRLRGEEVVESVAWSELVHVSIRTNDQGPFVEDFYFLLGAADGTGCAVPNDLTQKTDLLARLQRLPGFANGAVIAASGSTADAEFDCWHGRPGEGLIAATPETDAAAG